MHADDSNVADDRFLPKCPSGWQVDWCVHGQAWQFVHLASGRRSFAYPDEELERAESL